MKLVRLSLLLFLAVFFLPLSAQLDRQGCATPPYKSEWLRQFQKGLIARVTPKSDITYVPMNIVVVGENDGSGYLNPVLLVETLQQINLDFEDQNIQFFIRGDIKFIDNTTYYDHTFEQGRVMMQNNNVAGAINVYWVGNPAEACGYYSSGRDAIAMGNNCTGLGSTTFAHEMGHFLSLPHTFLGWECVEEISEIPDPAPANLGFPDFSDCNDLSASDDPGPLVETVERVPANCENAGDGFCDTAADYLMQRWICNNLGESDSLTDPNGVRFVVAGTNVMSYSNDNCQTGFSDDQRAAMLANLNGRPGLIDNENVVTEGPDGSALVQIYPEDDETIPANNFVELKWNSVPNADFYILQLHSNPNLEGAVLLTEYVSDTTFTITEGLIARRRYYWRVRPVNNYVYESDFSETIRFRNGEFPVATIDHALDAAITVAPNPVHGGRVLRISSRDLGTTGTLNLELIGASGRVVVSRPGLSVSANGFEQTIETGSLPQGVYFLRLRLNDRLVTRRVVVTP